MVPLNDTAMTALKTTPAGADVKLGPKALATAKKTFKDLKGDTAKVVAEHVKNKMVTLTLKDGALVSVPMKEQPKKEEGKKEEPKK
jgi:hypothetical protein